MGKPERNILSGLLETREGTALVMLLVNKLMKRLEQSDFGMEFGLYLHFEMNEAHLAQGAPHNASGIKEIRRTKQSVRCEAAAV